MVQYVYDPSANRLYRVRCSGLYTKVDKKATTPVVVRTPVDIDVYDVGSFYVLNPSRKVVDLSDPEIPYVFYPDTKEIFKLKEVVLQ